MACGSYCVRLKIFCPSKCVRRSNLTEEPYNLPIVLASLILSEMFKYIHGHILCILVKHHFLLAKDKGLREVEKDG